jgi:uncharacterized protein YneF (UPF0154 family)
MKNKSLWIVAGITALVVGGYFVMRRIKFQSQNPQKNERKISLVSTN